MRHYNRLSKRNFDLDTGFYPLGSCTMKHNPKLHERVAALPGNARLHPFQAPAPGPGRAGADVEPGARAGRGLGASPRVAAAQRRLARRAGRRAPDPRLPRRPRRRAHPGAHARHGPRHQPGHGDDGRLRGGEGGHGPRRRRRPGGPAGEGRRPRRLPDAHQPEHAGPLRPQHRGDRADRPRRRRHPLLRRRQPERGHGHQPPGRHGLRHRALQPAQVVHPAARRGRPGRRPDRGLRPHRALPHGAAHRAPRGRGGRRGRVRPRRGPPQVDRPAARVPGQLRRLRALLRVHLLAGRRGPARGVGDRGAERQLPAGAAAPAGAPAPARRSGIGACTSSSCRGRP